MKNTNKQYNNYIKKNCKTTFNNKKYKINNIKTTMSTPENNQQKQ